MVANAAKVWEPDLYIEVQKGFKSLGN